MRFTYAQWNTPLAAGIYSLGNQGHLLKVTSFRLRADLLCVLGRMMQQSEAQLVLVRKVCEECAGAALGNCLHLDRQPLPQQ
jgi:hypothetical protein